MRAESCFLLGPQGAPRPKTHATNPAKAVTPSAKIARYQPTCCVRGVTAPAPAEAARAVSDAFSYVKYATKPPSIATRAPASLPSGRTRRAGTPNAPFAALELPRVRREPFMCSVNKMTHAPFPSAGSRNAAKPGAAQSLAHAVAPTVWHSARKSHPRNLRAREGSASWDTRARSRNRNNHRSGRGVGGLARTREV